MADFPVATQDDIAAAQAREAAGKAAAEAANLAWRTNTAPILPVMGAGSYSGITQEQQADAAREAAKHAAAFHPAEYYGVSPSSLGNVPLSQIAARYGTGFADIVQGYYTQNPTAEAQAIKQQYAAQKGIVENPFAPDTAAGIAWEVSRTGGVTTAPLARKAIGEGYQGDIFAVSGISAVPTRDLSSGMLTGSKMVAALSGGTTTVYMPYGEYVQIEMKGAKALLDYQTGELGVYQQPFGHSQFMLTGGGGRAALQSGMFTVEKPETPYVVSQEGVGKYALPSGAGLSRLGAEAYGGLVMPLRSDALLAPNSAISRYYGAGTDTNLANLVAQIPAGKAEAPGANIPWSVSPSTPAMSYMNERGIIPGSAIATPSESGRLARSKVVGGAPTYGTAEAGAAPTLPTPFISTSEPSKETQIEKFQIAAAGGYSGGLIGATLWGPKSPEVIKGFAGSVVDFVTGVATLGQWQPVKERMQQTDEGLVAFREEKTKLESGLSIPASYEKDLSSYEKQKAAYDVKLSEYTQKASQYERSPTKSESEYASLMSEYSTLKKMGTSLESTSKSLDVQAKGITEKSQAYESFMKGGVEKGYLVYSGGRLVENPSLTYDYGEYSKAGMSLGSKFRELTGGYTPEQIEMYGTQLEQKKGIQYIPEKIVFGVGSVASTHPEKIATAYGGGAALVIGGGAIGGTVESIGAGTGMAATAARAALTGGRYILPVVFTGAMGYSVTEGLTATPERTTINIGKMLPEAAGAAVGGGSAYLIGGSRLPLGFQTREEPIPTIDLTKSAPPIKSPIPAIRTPERVTEGIRLETGRMSTTAPEAARPFTPEFKLGDYTPLPSAAKQVKLRSSQEPVPLPTIIQRMVKQEPTPAATVKKVYPVEPKPASQYTPLPGIMPTRITSPALPEVFTGKVEVVSPKATPKTSSAGISGGYQTPQITIARPSTIVETPMIDLTAATKITQVGKARMPETITRASFREMKTAGESAQQFRQGAALFKRRAGKKAAQELAFQMKVQKQLPGVEGVPEFISTTRPTMAEQSMFLLKDALARRRGTAVITAEQQIVSPLEDVKLGALQGPKQVTRQRPQLIQPIITTQPQRITPSVTPSVTPQVTPKVTPSVTQPPVQRITRTPQAPPVTRQKQTPYVPPVFPTTSPPVTQQKQTLYVPPVYPTITTPTRPTPEKPQKQTPYVPPYIVTPPGPQPPTPKKPKPTGVEPPGEVPPPPVFGGGGFLWPAGTSGSTPGRKPRRAAFVETFMMGLDVGFGMGGRRPRAKSFTTPKKYKQTTTAKKKGGKK